MPEFTTYGILKIFVAKAFEKGGETVEYNTAYFLTEDEDDNKSVVVVNTKQYLADQIDTFGAIKLRVGQNGKMSLVSFKEGTK
jgi:ABC-type oligopeptide transport system substrate-binding subunit